MSSGISAKAICLFEHQGRFLVHEFRDPTSGAWKARPLGGTIEFGETSTDAIIREIREELDQEIDNLRLVHIHESLFTYDGAPGHENCLHIQRRFCR